MSRPTLPLFLQRALHLMPRVYLVPAVGVSLACLLAGCSSREPATPQIKVASPSPQTSKSAGDNLAFGGWAELVQRWQSYPRQQPSPVRRPMNTGLPVNIALIASRHPAWRLAQALENNTVQRSSPFSAPNDFSVARTSNFQLSPLGFDANWNQSTWSATRPRLVSPFAWPASTNTQSSSGNSVAGGLVLANGLPALQNQMSRRQQNALMAFLGNAEDTQKEVRDNDLKARLAAMQEAIDRAREVNLSVIDPLMPDDAIQLEMTNLRLHLQVLEAPGNVFAKPDQIAAARARLAEIEAAWRGDLRAQEETRRNLLARLRDERPRNIERQLRGETTLALQAAEQRDEAQREAIGAAARRRIAEDFESADARLGIIIPATTTSNSLTNNSPSFRTSVARRASRSLQSSTTASIPALDATHAPFGFGEVGIDIRDRQASVAPPEPARSTADERQEQIRRLRALAWSDARQWARVVARRDAAFQRSQLQRVNVQKTVKKPVR